jgi:hypothetical protein
MGFYFGLRLGGLFFDQSSYQINERGNFKEEYDETPLNKNLFRDLDEIRFSSITLPVGINYPITHRWWLYGGFGIGSVQSYRKYEDRSDNSEIWVRDKTIGSFRFTLDVGVKVHLDFITFQLGLSKYPESLKLAFGVGILFNH